MRDDWKPHRVELTDAERADLMARMREHNEDKRRRWAKRMENEGKRLDRLQYPISETEVSLCGLQRKLALPKGTKR